jgi:hypothetical protein
MARPKGNTPPMETKQCKMTQREIDFIQMYADKLQVTWSDALRRLVDSFIDRYEDSRK